MRQPTPRRAEETGELDGLPWELWLPRTEPPWPVLEIEPELELPDPLEPFRPEDEPGAEPTAPGADMGHGYDDDEEPGPRSDDGPGIPEVFRSGS